MSTVYPLEATSIRYCNADNQTPLVVFNTDASGNVAMTPVQPGGTLQAKGTIGFFICNKDVCGFPTESVYCTQTHCNSSCSMASLENRENVYVTVGYLGNGLSSFVGAYPLNIYSDHCQSTNFTQFINMERQMQTRTP